MNAFGEGPSAGVAKSHYQETVMAARRVAANVGEIEILCDEEPTRSLRGSPNVWVSPPRQSLSRDRIDIMSERLEDARKAGRQILVEL